MTYRANENGAAGLLRAKSYLVGRFASDETRAKSEMVFHDIVDEFGPVVDYYPTWHPLVAAGSASSDSVITPGDGCGYVGLDHTVYLRNAFITCPYHGAERIIESVRLLSESNYLTGVARLSAEKIDATFYNENAQPVLIKCEWLKQMAGDGTIPPSVAIPLILEREVPEWRTSQFSETWDTMRRYLFGQPCGSRSSQFVNQETGQKIKTLWKYLTETQMWGPVKQRF